MYFTKSFLSTAMVLALTACGSGGSGGGVSVPTITTPSVTLPASQATSNQKQTDVSSTVENSTNNNNSTIGTSEIEKPIVDNSNVTTLENTQISINKDDFVKGELPKVSIENNDGKEIANLSGYNRAYSFNGALTKTKDTSLTEIVVDNVVLKLTDKVGAGLGGISGVALSKTITAFYNSTKDPERDIFYFGDETPTNNIPKSGIATYSGNATRYDNVTAQVKNIGTSEFTADFDNKKIKGELKIDGLFRRNISLKETDIQGNSFRGEAVAGENNILITRKGEYEGKFFGPNAEELAGKATFAEAQKDLNTSFSAEQVK